MSHNILSRFIFDDMPIRGLHIRLQETWQEILVNTDYPPLLEQALGELLVAANLLAANLKFSGSLILQMQGTGALKLLVAEANSDGTCRATARFTEEIQDNNQADIAELLGEGGVFVMTLQRDNAEPWQGMVAIEGQSIAQMLMNYMKQSEQLETHLVLSANADCAAGLLLQRLPEKEDEEENWQYVNTLAQTISSEELRLCDADTLLYRLYHQNPPRLLSQTHIAFACTCSSEKVGNMLLLLGEEEVEKSMQDNGIVDIHCDFCRANYVFDAVDIKQLFATKLSEMGVEKSSIH